MVEVEVVVLLDFEVDEVVIVRSAEVQAAAAAEEEEEEAVAAWSLGLQPTSFTLVWR